MENHREKVRQTVHVYDKAALTSLEKEGNNFYLLLILFSASIMRRDSSERAKEFAKLETQLQKLGW
jgi:hypothetical protein